MKRSTDAHGRSSAAQQKIVAQIERKDSLIVAFFVMMSRRRIADVNDEELAQLAHLLRVVAEMSREIIVARGPDVREVYELAMQASEIADRLDAIVRADVI